MPGACPIAKSPLLASQLRVYGSASRRCEHWFCAHCRRRDRTGPIRQAFVFDLDGFLSSAACLDWVNSMVEGSKRLKIVPKVPGWFYRVVVLLRLNADFDENGVSAAFTMARVYHKGWRYSLFATVFRGDEIFTRGNSGLVIIRSVLPMPDLFYLRSERPYCVHTVATWIFRFGLDLFAGLDVIEYFKMYM